MKSFKPWVHQYSVLRNFYSFVRAFHLILFLLFISLQFDGQLLSIGLLFAFTSQIFIVNIVGHRMIGHSVFRLANTQKFFFLLWHAYLGLMSPLVSSLIHKKHHIHSDTLDDPHSPPTKIFALFSFLGSLFFNRLHVTGFRLREILKETRRKYFLFFHYNSPLISMGFTIVLFLLGGFDYIFYFQSLPVVICALGQISLVVITHIPTTKPYTHRESQDSIIANLLTLGEGAHESHHKKPKQIFYKNGPLLLFDLTGFIISKLWARNSLKM